MVQSTVLSLTSTVILLLIEKMEYMLNSHFGRVSVRLISDPWPLGGTALFIDQYGRMNLLQTRKKSAFKSCEDIISLIRGISLKLWDLHKFEYIPYLYNLVEVIWTNPGYHWIHCWQPTISIYECRLAIWQSGGLAIYLRQGMGDVLLLRSYSGEVSYLHVIACLCHVTTLLCHIRDRTTEIFLPNKI